MVSQSVPVYVSEEDSWDNYTTGRNDEYIQGVYLGDGSRLSGGFSGGDMAGPSTTVREVRQNIRPDASRFIPAIISSTNMPSDNIISTLSGAKWRLVNATPQSLSCVET